MFFISFFIFLMKSQKKSIFPATSGGAAQSRRFALQEL
jgi:hypothetical protein